MPYLEGIGQLRKAAKRRVLPCEITSTVLNLFFSGWGLCFVFIGEYVCARACVCTCLSDAESSEGAESQDVSQNLLFSFYHLAVRCSDRGTKRSSPCKQDRMSHVRGSTGGAF